MREDIGNVDQLADKLVVGPYVLGVLHVSTCNNSLCIHTEVDCPEDLDIVFMRDMRVDLCPVASKSRPGRLFRKIIVITAISRIDAAVATEAWDLAIR